MARSNRVGDVFYQRVDQVEEECENDVKLNAQNVTFVVSIIVQLLVLGFSVVALAVGQHAPQVLTIVLWLETIVQLVEFLWYSIVGILFACGHNLVGKPCEFGTAYRYADWIVTTPTMLISLYFLILYFSDVCMTRKELVHSSSFAFFIVLIVLCDWAMLAVGFGYEKGWLGGTSLYGWRRGPMLIGFAFLFCAFIPHFYTIGHSYTGEGLAMLVVTLLLWSCYGVVATIWLGREHGLMLKNACYNVLDLLSKNAMGIVVSIIALNFKAAHGECS